MYDADNWNAARQARGKAVPALAILFPRVVAVPCSFRQAWLESGCLLGRCRERLPGVVLPLVKSIEHRVWEHLPKVSACGMGVKQRLLGRERVDPSGSWRKSEVRTWWLDAAWAP